MRKFYQGHPLESMQNPQAMTPAAPQSDLDALIAEAEKLAVTGRFDKLVIRNPELHEFLGKLRAYMRRGAAPQSDQPAQGERKQIEILRRWLFTVGVDEQSKRAEQLMALLKREGIVAAPASQPERGRVADELVHHMRGFAEECLRRIAVNPGRDEIRVDGYELHTKQTYTDIIRLCDRVVPPPSQSRRGSGELRKYRREV